MPELPEVESVVRALQGSSLLGKQLTAVEILCPKIPQELNQLLSQRLLKIKRRGKYLHFHFTELHLIVHLRMTGRCSIATAREVPRHVRVIFIFEGTQLLFHDTRRFGTFEVTAQPEEVLGHLGPEPLDPDFSFAAFFPIFSQSTKGIKAALLDQSMIAGVGNIYADEALWEAMIHPETRASRLNKRQSRNLFEAVRKVLMKGIENGGTSLGDGAPNFHHLNGQSGNNQGALNVYGKTGKPCSRCHQAIQRITVHQRSTHFCPQCQSIE